MTSHPWTDTPAVIRLSYNSIDPNASARQIIYTVFPQWEDSDENVEIKQLTEGTTNKLFKIVKKGRGVSIDQEEEIVLLRAFGSGTGVLVDREREYATHRLLSQHGLAPPIIARFENGLIYHFVPGRPCEPSSLAKEAVWRGVARRLGEWHAILPTSVSQYGDQNMFLPHFTHHDCRSKNPLYRRSIWAVLQKWISLLPEEKAPRGALQNEQNRLMKEMGVSCGWKHEDMVLGHCDLLSANIIVHPGKIADPSVEAETVETVSFIDYEYSMPCPAAFDIVNHFSEWAGFNCDYTLLPKRSVRREFLREYVHSYALHRPGFFTEQEDVLVNKLLDEVDALRGLPGFFWGICALVQATSPDIVMDFDCEGYAQKRLDEYWDWRAQVEGMEVDSERERSWVLE